MAGVSSGAELKGFQQKEKPVSNKTPRFTRLGVLLRKTRKKQGRSKLRAEAMPHLSKVSNNRNQPLGTLSELAKETRQRSGKATRSHRFRCQQTKASGTKL